MILYYIIALYNYLSNPELRERIPQKSLFFQLI